jgi:hypothetical protein
MDLYYWKGGAIYQSHDLGALIMDLYEDIASFPEVGMKINNFVITKTYINELRTTISQYALRVPLYDIISNSIYLIYKNNIYARILYENYRFVDESFYDDLVHMPQINDDDHTRRIVKFLSYYDLPELKKTYYKLFYESFVINSYITHCPRPSFKANMTHISPYYSINELYYLSYDWELTESQNISLEEINNLCSRIINYDIPAKILLDHQIYIYDHKAIGLVKHYSLFGSDFMNQYLRKNPFLLLNIGDKKYTRNLILENQIKLMVQLISNAPKFTISHTVYRFIDDDFYLSHLKPGDIYQEPSFISTTRNPFYYQENYQFGYILIKIKLPADIDGIGLCVESYSNFPKEEEIILPPTSMLRLDRIVTHDESYQHILNKHVAKKYEFTFVGTRYDHSKSSDVIMNVESGVIPVLEQVDFKNILKLVDLNLTTLTDRLQYFIKNYLNVNYLFETDIGGNKYTLSVESYDSSGAYKDFFYYTTSNGILIYSSNPKYGNINLMMEVGQEIHVNYYFKFSVTDSSHQLDLNQVYWIEWFAMLAYSLGLRYVTIHANYVLKYDRSQSAEEKIMKTRYTFSQNVYLYLKSNIKYFDKFLEVKPNFEYYQLDYLRTVKPSSVLNNTDRDELYQLYIISTIDNLATFYLYVVDNYPRSIPLLELKMASLYTNENNPFQNISYTLDSWSYLYNNNYIQLIPEYKVKRGAIKNLIVKNKIPQFQNRIRYYLT